LAAVSQGPSHMPAVSRNEGPDMVSSAPTPIRLDDSAEICGARKRNLAPSMGSGCQVAFERLAAQVFPPVGACPHAPARKAERRQRGKLCRGSAGMGLWKVWVCGCPRPLPASSDFGGSSKTFERFFGDGLFFVLGLGIVFGPFWRPATSGSSRAVWWAWSGLPLRSSTCSALVRHLRHHPTLADVFLPCPFPDPATCAEARRLVFSVGV
jgi:hypothetical protein